MSSETFANPAVKALIDEHCIFVESNISHDSKIADWLAVEAVPDVCILSQEGVLLDRITGFLSADEFLPRLKRTIP